MGYSIPFHLTEVRARSKSYVKRYDIKTTGKKKREETSCLQSCCHSINS